MSKRGFTPEQIIRKLREAEGLRSKGEAVGKVVRKLGFTYVRTTIGAKNTAAFRKTAIKKPFEQISDKFENLIFLGFIYKYIKFT